MLGSNDSRHEHSFFSWVAMLFAAGMGIGLMYFRVAEPMQHYSEEVFADQSFTERAKNAQLFTFFHWGVHAWAIYATVGLALSYFAYRYRLPLSLRSCFYPLLKNKINGKWGDAIDIFALCSTFSVDLRSEEHTSELQSRGHLVCRLLLEKKNK